jgi:DNA-binding transcriptional MerR regulator
MSARYGALRTEEHAHELRFKIDWFGRGVYRASSEFLEDTASGPDATLETRRRWAHGRQLRREGGQGVASRLLTLPQVARIVGVGYRTLHSWLRRGLLRPSLQQSSGTGVPNLFSADDAVQIKVIADLRQTGVSFERLSEAAAQLAAHPTALKSGATVLVNGSVSVVEDGEAWDVLRDEQIALVYKTSHAVREVAAALTDA